MTRLILRDLQLALGGGLSSALALIFFLMVATLVPFAIGPDAAALGRIAPGMIWLAALLATLLTLERIFQPDADDGTLDQLLAGGLSPELLLVARMISHWLTTALPLLMVTPLAGLILGLLPAQLGPVMLGLLLGTPAFSALGCTMAALAVGVRRGGMLIALLLLPMLVPLLIFGIGSASGEAAAANLRFLGAASLVALAIAPFAGGSALRLAVS
jgi:heme exporter protein B